MNLRALTLAVLLAAGGHHIPVHTKGTPPSRMTQCCTPPGVSPQNVIMPLGDSITVGYCSTSGDGYRGPLDGLLSTHVWAGSQQSDIGHHEGHGGWAIDPLADNVQGWIAQVTPAPQVVLVDAGTNDDEQNRSGAQMLASMSRLLDNTLAVDPNVKVVVAQITITTYNTADQQVQEQIYDDGLPALAVAKGPRVRVVDMRGVELSPVPCAGGPEGVHPDDAGYSTMATRWHDTLVTAGWIR